MLVIYANKPKPVKARLRHSSVNPPTSIRISLVWWIFESRLVVSGDRLALSKPRSHPSNGKTPAEGQAGELRQRVGVGVKTRQCLEAQAKTLELKTSSLGKDRALLDGENQRLQGRFDLAQQHLDFAVEDHKSI